MRARLAPFWHEMRLAAVVAALCLALLPGGAGADPVFPPLTGRIVDEVGLLSAGDRAEIEAQLADLEKASTDQLAVVTLRSLQGYPIEDFGYRLGRAWGIGQKDKDNGVLLIVAPNERKVRIEVGRGLEPVLTDAMSKLIVDNAIVPEFRRGDYAAGIKAGVRDVKDVLLGNAEAVRERAKVKSSSDDTRQLLLLLFWIAVVLFVMWAIYRSSMAAPAVGPGGRRRTLDHARNSGGWNGGWSGGGGGGGGGWSGGGGGFGGGGSSGSW